MEIEIRQASDPGVLALLNREVQELHHKNHPEIFKPFDEAEVTAWFASVLNDPDNRLYVAWMGRQPCGMIKAYRNDRSVNPFVHPEPIIRIDQIVVRFRYRKLGIGSLLLHRVKDWARVQKVNRIELDHWTFNEDARAFFTAQGFRYFNERMSLDSRY